MRLLPGNPDDPKNIHNVDQYDEFIRRAASQIPDQLLPVALMAVIEATRLIGSQALDDKVGMVESIQNFNALGAVALDLAFKHEFDSEVYGWIAKELDFLRGVEFGTPIEDKED